MSPFVIFPYYLVWHYTRAIGDFFTIAGNLIWFIYYYFSISILFKTLFKPIRSLKEFSENQFKNRGPLFDYIINIGLVASGLFIRLAVISIGILSLLLSLIIATILFFVWLILPPLIIFIMIVSLIGIIKT
jgi:hypothetical protein